MPEEATEMARLGVALQYDANHNVIQGPLGFRIEDATSTPYAVRSPKSVTSGAAVGLAIPSDAISITILSTQAVYVSTESNVATTAGALLAANTSYTLGVAGISSGSVYLIAASTTASVSFSFNVVGDSRMQRNSWKLDGATQLVTLPATLMSPATTAAWAVAFWIKPVSVTSVTLPILVKALATPVAGFDIYQVNATIRVRTYKAGPATETTVSAAALLVADEWHHITISKAAGAAAAITIQKDGAATTNGTAGAHTTAPSAATLVLGGDGSAFLNSKITGLRMFSTVVGDADAVLLAAYSEAATATLTAKYLARESMAASDTAPTTVVDSVAGANGTVTAPAYAFFDPDHKVV